MESGEYEVLSGYSVVCAYLCPGHDVVVPEVQLHEIDQLAQTSEASQHSHHGGKHGLRSRQGTGLFAARKLVEREERRKGQ